MLRNKPLLINAIILFIFINTSYYWGGYVGHSIILFAILTLIDYMVLLVGLIYQLFLLAKNWQVNKTWAWKLLIVSGLLVTIALKPDGVIDYEKFGSKDVLFAQRIGAASCASTLRLKYKGEFQFIETCFGVSESTGSYDVKNDTIYFKFSGQTFNRKFEFGVYKPGEFHYHGINGVGEILLFRSTKDTLPFILPVYKNHVFNDNP